MNTVSTTLPCRNNGTWYVVSHTEDLKVDRNIDPCVRDGESDELVLGQQPLFYYPSLSLGCVLTTISAGSIPFY